MADPDDLEGDAGTVIHLAPEGIISHPRTLGALMTEELLAPSSRLPNSSRQVRGRMAVGQPMGDARLRAGAAASHTTLVNH
ncbi:hypothetical protein [Paracoccus sp. SSK6]|uniref:hypothetical protein n=1 Tax=Paracoccus sp. SSK6 TaxID=3143131 RepID=UPI003219A169